MADSFVSLLAPSPGGPGCAQRRADGAADAALRALLSRWNRVLNLTSIRTTKRQSSGTTASACSLPRCCRQRGRILDLGSGAGFPGFRLRPPPGVQVTLLESHKRKAVFLREATRDLSEHRGAGRARRGCFGRHGIFLFRGRSSPSEVLRPGSRPGANGSVCSSVGQRYADPRLPMNGTRHQIALG